ncbi:MAG: InlB B-repeat-containing protein [Clostridia bacterium]|nr:InlB B-repeat-containing protein [Clostridia bacterium]
MKSKTLLFIFILWVALVLTSCVQELPAEPEIYEIGGDSFEVLSYDFITYNNIGVNGNPSSKSYGFYIEAECECSLIEYTATLEFYSLENTRIFKDTETSSYPKSAGECIKIQLNISDDVYESTYKVKVTFTGKTNEANKGSSAKTEELEYFSVSFMDGSHLYAHTRAKKENTVDTSKFPAPEKDDYIFCGWYLDSTLTKEAVFPLKINAHTKLYASWLRIKETTKCKDSSIKCWDGYSSYAGYGVTPSDFDFERLAKEGYNFHVKISYDVYYVKDYDVPLDIGYAGAPKYEAYLTSTNGKSYGKKDLTTTTSSRTVTMEYNIKLSEIINEKWTLEFSTDNIQNIIRFKNIVIEFSCVK